MQKKDLFSLLEEYRQRAQQRKEQHDLPPRPLTKEEVEGVVKGLTLPDLDEEEFTVFAEPEAVSDLLVRLLTEEVRRGTFPSSYAKAEGLANFVRG